MRLSDHEQRQLDQRTGEEMDRVRMRRQKEEFDACYELSRAYNALPAVVDDDYPRARHEYEGALRAFIAALRANGRL